MWLAAGFLAALTEFERLRQPGQPAQGRIAGSIGRICSLANPKLPLEFATRRLPSGPPFLSIQISPIAKEGIVVLRSILRRLNINLCVVGATLLAGLSIVATPSASADESGPDPSPGFTIIPGGVADTRGTVAYLANASEGIDAIDMATGRPLWDTKQGVYPMALDGDWLIAKAPHGKAKPNVMNVVVLDATTGKKTGEARQIEFPDWISVDGGIGLKFDFAASIEGSELTLVWLAERQFAGIVEKKAEAAAASTAHKVESGSATLNLETGGVEVNTDSVLRIPKLPRAKPYYDVGDKRLNMTETTEDVPGGIRLIHRALNARDTRSGKPLWRHEIAGDVILPANLPSTAERTPPAQAAPKRR